MRVLGRGPGDFGQLEFGRVLHWAGASAATAALTALGTWAASGFVGGWKAGLVAAGSAVLVTLGKGAHEWASDNTNQRA